MPHAPEQGKVCSTASAINAESLTPLLLLYMLLVASRVAWPGHPDTPQLAARMLLPQLKVSPSAKVKRNSALLHGGSLLASFAVVQP